MIYAELTSEPRYRKNNFYRISLSTENQLSKNLVEIGISPDGTDNNTTLLDFNRSEAKHFFKTALEIIQAIEEEENETDDEEEEQERAHFVMQVLSDGHMIKVIQIYSDECDCKVGDVVKAIIRKKG